MRILDLTETKGEGAGLLEKVGLRRDGGREKGLVYDLEIAFDLTTAEDAEVVNRIVPGASEHFERAEAARESSRTQTDLHGAAAGSVALAGVGGKASVKVPGPDYDIELSNDGGKVVLKAGAEVKSASLNATGKKITYEVKLRVNGLDAAAASIFAELLGETVTISTEKRQQVLPFAKGGGKPIPEIGSVVAGSYEDEAFAGVVVGSVPNEDDKEGEADLEIEDVDGTKVTVPASAVSSEIRVVAEDGKTLDSVLKLFKQRTKKANVQGSWAHLLVAITKAYGAGGAAPVGDAWTLTATIVDDAVEIGKARSMANRGAAAEA